MKEKIFVLGVIFMNARLVPNSPANILKKKLYNCKVLSLRVSSMFSVFYSVLSVVQNSRPQVIVIGNVLIWCIASQCEAYSLALWTVVNEIIT